MLVFFKTISKSQQWLIYNINYMGRDASLKMFVWTWYLVFQGFLLFFNPNGNPTFDHSGPTVLDVSAFIFVCRDPGSVWPTVFTIFGLFTRSSCSLPGVFSLSNCGLGEKLGKCIVWIKWIKESSMWPMLAVYLGVSS